jgi:serine O-acetyltransferase
MLRLLYRLTDQRPVIDADVARWSAAMYGGCSLSWLSRLPEFRSLVYYRLSRGNRLGRIAGAAVRRLWPGERTLFFATDTIGPGLFIQHGFATIIAAQSVGSNCWINQQVTIGFKQTGGEFGAPILEDDVSIHAGAQVLGPITVGHSSVVGANAVVVKDVPPNSIAVGVPAISRPRSKSTPAAATAPALRR